MSTNRECQDISPLELSKLFLSCLAATSSVLLAFGGHSARALSPNELNLFSKTCGRFNSLKISELGRLVPYTRSPGVDICAKRPCALLHPLSSTLLYPFPFTVVTPSTELQVTVAGSSLIFIFYQPRLEMETSHKYYCPMSNHIPKHLCVPTTAFSGALAT